MKEAVRSLEQALYSKDRYVRAYAAEALTHLRTEEAVDILIRYYRTSRWCPDTSKVSTF
ncbi:HEAT repeat domain-containing protein [Paenibacillus sp. V4I7]|uniref:HEAT repeat domain-containing protein n=1 Tax=unclassified Paenibacillus TaxID=185978 RepID=UPI003593E8B1